MAGNVAEFRIRELERRMPIRQRIERGGGTPEVGPNEVVFWEDYSDTVNRVKILVRLTDTVNTFTLQTPAASEVLNDSAVSGTYVDDALEVLNTVASDATKHRIINDSGESATELYSSSKIVALLGALAGIQTAQGADSTAFTPSPAQGTPGIGILDRSAEGSPESWKLYVWAPGAGGTWAWYDLGIGGGGR